MFSGRYPFSEHIDELRKRVRVVALTFLVIFFVVLLFPANPGYSAQHLGEYLSLTFIQHTVIAAFLARIIHDLLPAGWGVIAATGIGEPMEIYFVASLLITLVLDMPVIAYETYKFIDPALTERERKLIYPFVSTTSVLFAVGITFGYFVLAKFLIIALSPFFVASGVSPLIDAGAFYYVIFLIIGSTGASFTSPVFVYTLIRLRVVEADFFSKNRVVIWFVIWVVTGLFLTPDGGPLLDAAIFAPIVALVELAVFLGRRSVKDVGGAPGSPQPPEAPPSPGKGRLVCPTCGKPMERPRLFCEHCGSSIA